jgi:DNA-binding CsgD family transcriptional regulator
MGNRAATGEGVPEREAALDPQQEEIREASMRLPKRQRKALALRERQQLSYDEIAAIMETNAHTVAQLISRARINLRDELHGTALASVAAPSPECERALPLIAMREDRQLEAASPDTAWLDSHLAGCDRCQLAVEAMQAAASSYRAWAPTAAVPSANRAGPERGKPPLRRMTLAGGLAALLLLAGIAAALARNDPSATPAASTAGAEPGSHAGGAPNRRQPNATKIRKTKDGAARKKAKGWRAAAETIPEPAAAPVPASTVGEAPNEAASSPNRSSGKTAVQPTRQTSTPKSSRKTSPAPTPATAAQPASAPAVEEPAPAEESPSEAHRRREPPGKPSDRPPR